MSLLAGAPILDGEYQGWDTTAVSQSDRRKSMMSCCCAADRALKPLTDPQASPTGVVEVEVWLAAGQCS
jgi:hypothetical protein